ncbi:MAG: hypothetical protein LBM16_03030 [Clostridiales bacterium]|jgi:heat-inducible transcriptional repressor|nr:hypothetical protein [Clostridiales bacterium]
MRDCSIIKTSYSLSDGKSIGAIGIIGPTRMDYPKVISVLSGIVRGINSILSG